jgi:DNA repair exonuclease SbcCD ATPase subunit
MAKEITNSEDIIDSREIDERIDELESEQRSLVDEVDEAQKDHDALCVDSTQAEDRLEELLETLKDAKAALSDWEDSEEGRELAALQALKEDAEGYCSDWRYGATLIRDSYFEDYARELAEDLHGRAIREATWPFDCIDWEEAKKQLQQDYTSVDFDGVEYWVRS